MKIYNKLLFGLKLYYAHSSNKLLLIHIDNQSLSEGEQMYTIQHVHTIMVQGVKL